MLPASVVAEPAQCRLRLADFLQRLLKSRPDARGSTGRLSGNAKREFLFVDDLVEACRFLGDFPEEQGPINIGSKQEVSIRELAETVREVVDYSGELVFDKSKPDGMPLKKVDTSQLDQLGWHSTTSLQAGLEKTYMWYLQQLELPSSERPLRS